MAMKYINDLLNYLLDKYERSKAFVENREIQRKIFVKITKIFPKYEDEAEYHVFTEINDAVQTLELKNFIQVSRKKNGVISNIALNTDKLNEIYLFASRKPKSETNQQLLALLESYADKNELLASFCRTQTERIKKNQKVELFSGDFTEYANLLKAVSELYQLKEETYMRDFSVRIFGDSKAFEQIKSKVINLLFHYGDFSQEETILEELNLMKNPGHVYIKGACKISVNGQIIDFSQFNADIAISSILLASINSIEVIGNKVITIENLTTFNRFCEENAMIIYLGGYHNTHRRNFIRKLYTQNPDVVYYHYGDIDAGGFYILLHLRNKTDIHFQPYHMDVTTLQQYSKLTKPLTDNDKKRLHHLADSEFSEVIQYMLKNNCKLEQEALA
ncbi:MAG: DUF2220 domain-containing protein [Oscillospiraceae bacterium]|nr:DUF2220 domain-containing protein [Oscillospiraceae bacterium]